jgi:hypothetical protein
VDITILKKYHHSPLCKTLFPCGKAIKNNPKFDISDADKEGADILPI